MEFCLRYRKKRTRTIAKTATRITENVNLFSSANAMGTATTIINNEINFLIFPSFFSLKDSPDLPKRIKKVK